jgi:hypothetical protein
MFGSVVPAPAIAIYSDAAGDGFGTLTCTTVGCPGVFNITSPPIPPWQDPTLTSQPSAKWVSVEADDGGFGSGPVDGTTNTFEYAFNAAVKSVLTLSVWADDTSAVLLDGGLLLGAAPGPYPQCAQVPIGCTPGTEGVFNLIVEAGNHTLAFDFSQLGGSGTPYGLLFAGELTATPEPATILLVGSALAAAGVATRKRFRKGEVKA